MADHKDIFSLFREHQHQLDRTPSPRAWQKLERRLDGHRRRNRLSTIRTISMAAAVLLLAVVAILISLALGEKPGRLLNQSPPPLASEQLQADDLEAAETLRLTRYAQKAEQQRRQPINEGPSDRKLVLAKNQSTALHTAGLDRLEWLAGEWQTESTSAPATINWSTQSPNALKGTAKYRSQTERLQLYQKDDQLFFASDFGKGPMIAYTLQYATPQTLVFENQSAGFPQRVTLQHGNRNRFSLIYENEPSPLTREQKSSLLFRKQRVWELRRLQLQ